ncbi:MAG TPA: hypothetical protein PK573_15135 [Spirochaetota bacterium]|nr:hypothetical protein [Spirochaetota bacterium]
MGAVIKSTGVCLDRELGSSVEYAAMAADECIANAGIDRNDVDLLINVGVFRDKNLTEPAMATMIQQRLCINRLYQDETKTFSFDIINGAGGLLNAVQAAGALLANGPVKNILIVSSDTHPSQVAQVDFPYTSAGAAMLLEWSDDPARGFRSVDFRTLEEDYIGTRASCNIIEQGTNASRTVFVEAEPDYSRRLEAFTIESIKDILEGYKRDHAVDAAKIKLLAAHPWKDFGIRVAGAAGINDYSLGCLYEKYGDLNSSALAVAYHDARQTGKIGDGDHILFVAAQSGLMVGAGLYRN